MRLGVAPGDHVPGVLPGDAHSPAHNYHSGAGPGARSIVGQPRQIGGSARGYQERPAPSTISTTLTSHEARPYLYAPPASRVIALFCVQCWGWRPGRVYFLTLLEPSRDGRTLALTARSASRLPR
jgi:hypothetical protein